MCDCNCNIIRDEDGVTHLDTYSILKAQWMTVDAARGTITTQRVRRGGNISVVVDMPESLIHGIRPTETTRAHLMFTQDQAMALCHQLSLQLETQDKRPCRIACPACGSGWWWTTELKHGVHEILCRTCKWTGARKQLVMRHDANPHERPNDGR